MRVGGFDALAILQAGGWQLPSVLMRYVENAATREFHERRWELTKQVTEPSLWRPLRQHCAETIAARRWDPTTFGLNHRVHDRQPARLCA
jgi:hypothetical protein